jgi:hypothetical protein
MQLKRRDILKGITLGAGATVLTPLVRQLEAYGADAAVGHRRFVFVVEGNGLPWQQIQPIGIDRGKNYERTKKVELAITDYELPKSLEPLAKYHDRVSVIQGLSGRVCGGGHSNDFGALGACAVQHGAAVPKGETIDVALARANPGLFPIIGLGISDRPEHTTIYNCSALAANKSLPTQCRPDLAYNSLFGSIAEGAGREAFAAQSNVLDFLAGDLKKLENRLSGFERERFQQYVGAFESLRDRQSRLNEIENTLREHAPVVGDKYRSDVETDRLDAHFDLAAASLIGGLTNVVTIASGVGSLFFSVRFGGLGIQISKHGIGHGGGEGGKSAGELATIIRRFHFELIARLMDKLNAMPEGNGSMLDNTVIVYLSDAAEGHHARCWEWPFVVIGDGGGKLKRGRYLEYPYYNLAGHRPINCLYNTLLHAAGAPRDDFGMADPMLDKDVEQTGPLAELLA